MKILIVEDETAAYDNLVEILNMLDPSISIVGNTESIHQTIRWLQTNPDPDLILMDIHLSDGTAFSIFNSINLEVPIIFTTAYDEYAIKAFKVNSIDYLLKPIKFEDLKTAFDKFRKWTQQDLLKYFSQITNLTQISNGKDKILVTNRDKLIPIAVSDISFFYATNKKTQLYLKTGVSYPYSKTLEQIEGSINQREFFRANKQFIISRSSVKDITIWFDSRLLITIEVEPPEKIYVSKNRSTQFKAWLVNEKL